MKYNRSVLDLFHQHAQETDARVKAGIEANRKGPMTLVFKDADGKILDNVHVKVVQKTHDFKYGADLFMLDEIPDDAGYFSLIIAKEQGNRNQELGTREQ